MLLPCLESLPDAALRLSCPQPLPDAALCLPYWEMLPCLQLLPDSPSHRHFRWQLLPDAAAAAPAGASPAQQLPHGGNPRSGNLFRTDFRFAPSSRSASLAGPSIHEGMDAHGLCRRVPDSAGNVSSWPGAAFLQIT
ncbi:MAG: hypothetical protein SPG81_05440, partial [Candidatus Egerieousia sp.]|nr:hypothetical protein [Candidatus Egerieousia sp.]